MADHKEQIEKNEGAVETFSIEKACKSNNFLRNLQYVIESHPDESAKNWGMSILHLLNDNYDKMLACLKFIAVQHPNIALIQRRIAEFYIHRNNYQAAIPYLEKTLELSEEDMTAKIWLNLSYYATGNEKKAKSCLKSLKGYIFLMHAANNNWLEQES